MKQNIIRMLVLGFILTITPACSDFLDKLPENKVEEESVDYSKTEDMYLPVSGVYATLRQKMSFWAAYGLISVRGDDVAKGSTATDQVEFLYAKLFQYEDIKDFWALNATWEGHYYIISIANSAIESLDKYAAFLTTDTEKLKYNRYTAEVRFLRALSYFRITNFWGNVPLLLNNQQLNVEKSPRADVLNYITTELEYCVNNLPDLRPNQQTDKPGAVTKYSALALLAKVYLYQENWQGTLTATNQIINSKLFSLYNDYYQLFKIPGKLSNESLFEIQFTDFDAGSGDIVRSDQWFAFQGPRGGSNPIQGWGFMVPTNEIRTYFHQRGETVRDTTTFLLAGQTSPSGDFIAVPQPGEPTAYAGKAYTPANQLTPGRNEYGDNNNIRILRYADVLLMNAEASIRLSQSGDTPLNEVRRRAQMPDITKATLDDVLNERRVELALEWGERFFDLVRTGQAAKTLQGFVTGQSEYYPIPQNQIDLNPNLKK